MRIELRLPQPLYRPLDLSRVALIGEGGRPIAEPFLDLPLPSADGRRIALLMHPGRVKSGVGANLKLGRALHAGEVVTLVINDPALGRPVRKSWHVTAFDESRPSPSNWSFSPLPRAGTRQPLLVHLQSPISAASEGMIAVKGVDGRRLPGRIVLSEGETTWCFIPTRPWQAGPHSLVAHPDLENAAGNRNCAPFEEAGARNALCEAGQERPFEVRAR